MKKAAVFLDRDGVINKKKPEGEYVLSVEDFEILPGVAEAINLLNRKGYIVIVVTNQRGVARGLLSHEKLTEIHEYLMREISKKGAYINGIYACTHDKGQCDCRKPKPGLITKALEEHLIDIQNSYMIGDAVSDMEAGREAGAKCIFLERAGEKNKVSDWAVYSCVSLLSAAEFICNRKDL